MKKSTPEQAIKKIRKALREGKLGAFNGSECMYEDANGNMCGVGCLLSKEQREDLKAKGMNTKGIDQICDDYTGEENLLFATGLPVEILVRLQRVHDEEFLFKPSNVKVDKKELAKNLISEIEFYISHGA